MSLLSTEHKFNSGITGLRKAEKMSMTILVLVAQTHQQPKKTLKQWRKWFWIISYLISFGSSQAIFADILGVKRVTAKIVPKQHRMDIAQEMLKTFNDDLDLLRKVITGDELWVYGYDIKPKPKTKIEKMPVKFGQM